MARSVLKSSATRRTHAVLIGRLFMHKLNKKLVTLLGALLVLALGSIANAAFLGTQNGFYPITGNNTVLAGAAMARSTNWPMRIARLGTDKNVYVIGQRPDGSWDSWTNLGGPIKGAPAAGYWRSEEMLIVGLGNDGAYYYRKQTGSNTQTMSAGWGPWTSLGGAFATAPAVTGYGNGRYFVCGVATNGALRCGFLTSNGFQGFKTLGMPTASGKTVLAIYSPCAYVTMLGSIELYMIGSDKKMYHATWLESYDAWTVWDDLGGQFSGSPSAAGWASDDYVVIGVGTDLALWRKRFMGANNIYGGPWDSLGAGTVMNGTGVAAMMHGDKSYDVIVEGTNGGLFWNYYHE
jgi:hypothetical protein